MKRWLPVFFLLALIAAITWSKQVTNHSYEVIATFCLRMLPNLAPCLLLDYLFINTNGLYYLQKFFLKYTRNKRVYSLCIIILGMLSGTPTLATYVQDSLEKKLISPKVAQAVLNSFAFPSFPFLVGVLFVPFSLNYKLFLLILLLGSGFINYQVLVQHEKEIICAPQLQNHHNIIRESILDTAKTLLLMLGTMLLFSLPMPFLNLFLNHQTALVLGGLLEFSTNLYYLSNYQSIFLKTAFIFLITFSSFSVFSQIKIMCPRISIKKVIKNRLLLAVINSLISFIIFYFSLF